MLAGKSKSNKIRRAACLIVMCAVIISGSVLNSCGTESPTAMSLTYGDNTTTISTNMYSYFMSQTKTRMLYSYYALMYSQLNMSISDISALTDIQALWSEPYPYAANVTWAEYVKEQADTSVKYLLAIVAYCKENGIALTKEDKDSIGKDINNLTEKKYNRSKSELNAALIRFSVDDKILKEILEYEIISDMFSNHLFNSSTGIKKVTDEMIDALYQEGCVRVKHIFLKSAPGTKDEENNPIQYSSEELAERYAKIDDWYDRITGGEDLESFLPESEDTTMPADAGYTISAESGFFPECIEAAFEMKTGEVRKIKSEYGMHILKKYDLLPAGQAVYNSGTGASWKAYLNSEWQNYIKIDLLKDYIDKIEINADETSLFNIASSAVMFDMPDLWFY